MISKRSGTERTLRGSGVAAMILVATLMVAATESALSQPQKQPVRSHRKDCLFTLKYLATFAMMEKADRDGVWPSGRSFQQVRNHLAKKFRRRDLTAKCPSSGKPYLFNVSVSGLPDRKVRQPGETPLFRDSGPHADGTIGVVFLDGHCEKLSSKEVRKLGGVFK